MKSRELALVALGLLLLAGFWIAARRNSQDHSPAETSAAASPGAIRPAPASINAPAPPLPPPSSTNTPRTYALPPAPDGLNALTLQQLNKIKVMLRNYRTLFETDPVGTNAEIMKQIMGDNPHKARLGPPEGMSLNENGELVDPWGTPYFFHQLSGTQMEVHSAGPDKKMWTNDDIVQK